jgi:hypothetical protein
MTKQEEWHLSQGDDVSELQALRYHYNKQLECLQDELVIVRIENDIYKQSIESLRDELVIVRAKLENEVSKNRDLALRLGRVDDESIISKVSLAPESKEQGVERSESTSFGTAITPKLVALSLGFKKYIKPLQGSADIDRCKSQESDYRHASWDVLKNVPGVLGLLCSSTDLHIKGTTKKACQIWGSSKLHGQSFLSLLSRVESSKTLKKAIDKIDQRYGSQAISLGCVEMTTQSGRADFALTAVTLCQSSGSGDDVVIVGEKLQNVHFGCKRKTKQAYTVNVLAKP